VKREPRGRDLFSTHAGEELQTSAAAAAMLGAPQADDGRMTGQRNENSVLFSLAVLTKSGEDRAPDAPAQAKDDSGMIDLKALVARSESARPAARIEGDVFSAPLGIPQASLTSPLGPLGAQGADARPKSKLPLLIGAGGGMLIIMALGIFIGVKVAGGGTAAPLPSAAPSVAPVASASASAEPSASAASPEASASPSASVAATAKPKAAGGTGGPAWHPPAGGAKSTSGTSGAATSTSAAGLPPSPAPKKGGGGDCGCNGDLMCLMKCSTH
jgi:pilus assembly protein FimV